MTKAEQLVAQLLDEAAAEPPKGFCALSKTW